MHHLTIRQLDDILSLSNVVKRDWKGMSRYLRLDQHDSCPERHEIEGCPEYQKLQDLVDGLSLNALDELVALCLLGDAEPNESNTLDNLLRHVQGCPPDHRPLAELFEVENLFDNLNRGLARLGAP